MVVFSDDGSSTEENRIRITANRLYCPVSLFRNCPSRVMKSLIRMSCPSKSGRGILSRSPHIPSPSSDPKRLSFSFDFAKHLPPNSACLMVKTYESDLQFPLRPSQ